MTFATRGNHSVRIILAWYLWITAAPRFDPHPWDGSIHGGSPEKQATHTKIRGLDASALVLVFLAGGPGGSDLSATRRTLGGLEEHLVVAGWDQPGAGEAPGSDERRK